MKRKILPLILMILLLLSACGKDESKGPENGMINTEELPADSIIDANSPIDDSETLVISEKMFLTQINDSYFNFDSYKNKTIVVQGMYALFYNQEGEKCVPLVYRNDPGCCGNDGWDGFLLKYDGESPKENDWIEVIGTPELVDNVYYKDLYLNVTSISVLEERGAEFVTQ